MERLVFRPLRTQSAAVMLIATFAVAFLLQSIALPAGIEATPCGDLAIRGKEARVAAYSLADTARAIAGAAARGGGADGGDVAAAD